MGIMKVTIEIDVPDLGKNIKLAVSEDDRSVQIISTDVGISDATLQLNG